MEIWKFEIYANKSDQDVCCEVAVRAGSEKEAENYAKQKITDDSVMVGHSRHSNPRIGLRVKLRDGEVQFEDGEKVRLIKYKPLSES